MTKGLVHIYTGDGKGKTTAAIGLGIRACGNGLKVLMVQFLKSAKTGETAALEKLSPDFTIHRSEDVKGFFWNMTDEQKAALKKATEETFNFAVCSASSGEWDVLILDEIMAAISNGLISVHDVATFAREKPEKLELVLTGRNAPAELIVLADYVSDIKAVKHPFSKGIPSRKGIEY